MTWRRINSVDLVGIEIIGRTIAQNPDGDDHYEVKSIHVDGYITAFHSNGKTELKIMPDEKLIKDNWWIKNRAVYLGVK